MDIGLSRPSGGGGSTDIIFLSWWVGDGVDDDDEYEEAIGRCGTIGAMSSLVSLLEANIAFVFGWSDSVVRWVVYRRRGPARRLGR